jgi:hypothetical protein
MSYKRVVIVMSLITKLKFTLIGSLIAFVILSCQSQNQNQLKGSPKGSQSPKGFELSLFGENENNSKEKSTKNKKNIASKKKLKPKSIAISPNKKKMKGFTDYCRTLVTRFTPYYKDLINDLPPNLQIAHSARLDPIKTMDVESCLDDDTVKQTLAKLREISINYKPCVGFILPLTSSSHKSTEDIVRGLRAAYQDIRGESISFENMFKIRDSGGSAIQTKKQFSELTLSEQCGLIAGGVESIEAKELLSLAQGIQQPLLILSARTDIPPEAPSIFSMFPTQRRLAYALVKGSKARGIQKVAIMRPSHGRSDRLIEEFKQQFTSDGGTIIDEVPYSTAQFEAMQAAARKLFRTDVIGREAEYQDAIKKAQKKAELAGEKFNPKMVLLPPKVPFDALFVPDDFRSVRHLIKLIKYHMVSNLVLIGNHEWRSQGLLTPPEPFLDGSFFVDFVPRYDQIPRSIPVVFDGSPYFAQPQSAGQIDFQLIGYHLGRVILEFFNQAPQNRLAIGSSLATLKITDTLTSTPQAVFDNQRRALWPTFGYEIRQGAIQNLDVMTTQMDPRNSRSNLIFSKR